MSVLSLPECDVLEGLDDDQVGTLSHYVRDLILATDLSLHGMSIATLDLDLLSPHLQTSCFERAHFRHV